MVTMKDILITDNHAWSSSGSGGGALFSASVVKMTRTALTFDKADGAWGGAGPKLGRAAGELPDSKQQC